MAIARVLHGTGTQNLSTANCEYVSNADEIHTSTTVTVNSSNVGLAFTAPNLVNNATGVGLYFTTVGTGGTIVFNLQEYNGAAWVTKASTASITITTLKLGWAYFKFTTPYTYATLTASYYRISSTLTSGTGTFNVAAHLTSSTLYCTVVTDDRTAAFSGSALNTWIVGEDLGTYNVTVDTTGLTCGAGSADSATGYATPRHTGNALLIGPYTYMDWSTSADSDITLLGSYSCTYSSGLKQETAVPRAYTAQLIFNENGVSGNFGIMHLNTTLYDMLCWFKLQGTPPTYTRTKYTSGSGTAASPMLTTQNVADGALANPWAVNDELLICSTSGNTESETRYIKTIVGDNSFVLSSTPGGAEVALTYTHLANAHILNVTRNFVVTTTNTSHGWYLYENIPRTTATFVLQGVALKNAGGGGTPVNKAAVYLNASATTTPTSYVAIDNCVWSNILYSGLQLNNNGGTPQTMSENYFVNSPQNASNVGFSLSSSVFGKTLSGWFSVNNGISGGQVATSTAITLDDCHIISCNKGNSSLRYGLGLGAAIGLTVKNCGIHANLVNNIQSFASGMGITITDCEIGTVGTSTTDYVVSTGFYEDITFSNCNFGSATLGGGLTTMSQGSFVRFHKFNQTENYHFWYTAYGKFSSTGTGLPDTTVRTSGSLALNAQATNLAGAMEYSFKVFAKAGSAVSALGFIQRDATFNTTGSITVSLFLPGSLVADDTYTMPTTTGTWDIFIVAANYTGTVDGYATVIVTATSAAINGKFYVDDIFNGTNHITGLDLWENGMPSPIMFEQLGDASAVWQVPTSTLTAAGTIGQTAAGTLPLIPALL